jgi:hypothetical protein
LSTRSLSAVVERNKIAMAISIAPTT